MRAFPVRVSLALAIWFLAVQGAVAGGDHADIAAAANQITFGAGQLRMNYKEFNDGLTNLLPSVLDSENGRLATVQLGASGLMHRLYADARITITHGDTTYNGYLQPAPFIPYVGTTSNTIVSVYGRIGYPFRPASNLVLIPVIEAGEYFWRRDLGYTEDYSHLLIGVGGKLFWSPMQSLVVEAGVSYGTTLFANMTTDGEDFKLSSRPYVNGMVAFIYRLSGRWHLRLSGEYRTWRYGQSPEVDISGTDYVEPRSETVQVTKLLSVGYSFAR